MPSEEAEKMIDWVRSRNPKPFRSWKTPVPVRGDDFELRLARARAGISTILE